MRYIHHVSSGRRRKGVLMGLFVLFAVGICLCGNPIQTMAATSSATAADGARMETFEYLPLEDGGGNTTVGRYQLNYTGNVNYAGSAGNSNGSDYDITNYRSAVLPGYVNSSKATLTNDSGATGIVKAYLIWETRKRYNQYDEATNHVRFVMRDGNWADIYPDYVYVDNRFRPGLGGYWEYDMPRIYCNIADVTSIVQHYKYGDYYVANIPEFHLNDLWSNDGGGGQAPSAWQLVVIEEGEDFPVRAVTLKAGSAFRFGSMGFDGNGYTYPNGFCSTAENYKNVTVETMLASGLRSKTVGNVTGQVLFGSIDAGGQSGQVKDVSLYTRLYENAPKTFQYAGQTPPGGGINKYGTTIADGWDVVSVLYNVSGLENGANIFGVDIGNVTWNTQLFIGAAIDLAYPDFAGEQNTTVNSSNSVTVSGKFTNTASIQNTGIYNGNLVVTLDDALTPTSATAVVNGTSTISGIISGHTVTFSGSAVSSMMNGSSISYTVQCIADNSGKTKFDNTAGFNGYLRSDGVDTGYWIDRMWTAASSAVPKYSIALNAGDGIASVTGAGEYPYGSKVNIEAVLKPGYHWKGWSGSYSTAQQSYSFTMPAANLAMTASAEANTYMIHFDPNDGGEVTSIPNITVRYEDELTFPDASGAYVKYTLDGVNVTQEVLAGTLVQSVSLEDGEAEQEEAVATSQQETETGDDGAETEESEDEPELQAEEQEEQAPKVYESVFMGWSLADDKDGFVPQWTAGTVLDAVALIQAAGVTEQDGATITLYAVWDDCPWIQATDLYYTLEQAQSGFITQEEILSHATASDREDGSPIEPGFHENGTSFSIPDYSPTDFTQFQYSGSCTENLTVVDSVGSIYKKQITVYVVDTTPVAVKPEGTTRFINEYYYNQPYEKGGLEDNSVWKTDPEYVETIQEAFDNLNNDTPEESYYFSHETILEMKEFIEEHGVGNSKEEGALTEFYNRFMAPNKIE